MFNGLSPSGNNRGSETVREPLIDKYSKEELEEIVKGSKCMKDVLRSIGYSTVSGRNSDTVKKRIQKYGISTDHFKSVHPTKRNEDNVFCNHSTATQATLRRWYKKISDDSKCEICGQGKMWNGKELVMTLDHKNGDNHDNRIENLRWICPNCGTQLETFTGRNIKRKNEIAGKAKAERKMKICPVCGKNKINSQSKMCIECRAEERRKNIPDREELKCLIMIRSFVKVGEIYNVSDNAVRKWCKSYGLPYTRKAISQL